MHASKVLDMLNKVHLRYLCSTTSLTYARLGLKLYQDKYMHSSAKLMHIGYSLLCYSKKRTIPYYLN